jgi:acetoacetyl-CoA synthetase
VKESKMADMEKTNGVFAEKLWEHPDPKSTAMFNFMEHVNQKYSEKLAGYDDLYEWSIKNTSSFWGEVWKYSGIVGTEYTTVRLSQVSYIYLSLN